MSGLPKKLKKPPLGASGIRPEDVAIKPKPSINAPVSKRPITKVGPHAAAPIVKKQRLDFGNQPELFSTSASVTSTSTSSSAPPLPTVDFEELKTFCARGKCDEVDDKDYEATINAAVLEGKYNKVCRLIVAVFVKSVIKGQEEGKVSFNPMLMATVARVVKQNSDKLVNPFVPKCIFFCLSMSKTWSIDKQLLLTSIVTDLAESQQQLNPYYALAFLADCLGDRIWADKPHCSRLISLILRRFNTKFPSSANYKDTNGELTPPTWVPDMSVEDKFPPNVEGLTEAERDKERRRRKKEKEREKDKEGKEKEEEDKEDLDDIPLRVNVVEDVLTYLRRWWELRGDVPSRTLLRTMAVFSGVAEVRVAAARRLDVWLQNPKVQRQALDLLLSIGVNMESATDLAADNEALSCLVKMKSLKSKQVQAVFTVALSFISQNDENAREAVRFVVNNELGNAQNRSPLNMAILQTLFGVDNKKITRLLAEELCTIVVTRGDMMKAACILVKELARSHLRSDFYFSRFLVAFLEMVYSVSISGRDVDVNVTRTTAQVCNMIVWIGITPQVKETFAARRNGEHYQSQVYSRFCHEINDYFENALKWIRQSRVVIFSEMKDYITILYSLIFLDKGTLLMSTDGGPTDQEWTSCQRIISEVHPTQQLFKYVMCGDLCETPDTMQILKLLTQRTLKHMSPADQSCPLIEGADISMISSLFEISEFANKTGTVSRDELRQLSIRSHYWTAWLLSFMWCCCGKSPQLLKQAYDKYPTLGVFMHMIIVNDFSYPSRCDTDGEDIKRLEEETIEKERKEAIRVESLLAGTPISQTNSHLINMCCLTNPSGPARIPPSDILSELEHLSNEHSLGPRLCESRDPDLLAELVKKQGAVRAIPAISELLCSDPSSVDCLPVECLCEFLLHKLQHPEDSEDTDKMQMIYARLRSCVLNTDVSTPVLETTLFLLDKLSSSNVRERRAVGQVLSTIYAQESDAMDTDSSGALCLSRLSSSPHFERMKYEISIRLARACQLESDVGRLKSYLSFINEYSQTDERMHVTACYLSLLVQRAVPVLREDLMQFYARYIDCSSTVPFPSPSHFGHLPDASQCVPCVVESDGKKFTMSPLSITAQLELLCVSNPSEGGAFREKMIQFWFPKSSKIPCAWVDGKTIDIFPEELRAKMLCTDDENIVNIALRGVTGERAIRLLCRFGLTVHCSEKLMNMLDQLDIATVELSTAKSVRPFVIAYRGRGATGGEEFLKKLDTVTSKRITVKPESDELLTLEPFPQPVETCEIVVQPVLGPKELVAHIKTLISGQGDFALGSLEFRSVCENVQTAQACLEQMEGNLKYFLEHPHPFHLMLLMANAAAEKFPSFRDQLSAWTTRVLKATQPSPLVCGLLKRFTQSDTVQIGNKIEKKKSGTATMRDADAILNTLNGPNKLSQSEESKLLSRFVSLRPEIVDKSIDVDKQLNVLFSGTKNGLPWLASQLPLVASPETLGTVLHTVLKSYDPRLNTSSIVELLSFCACEGGGTICYQLKDVQLSIAMLYMVHEIVRDADTVNTVMKIIDALVSCLSFNCLRSLCETCVQMIRGDIPLNVRKAFEEMITRIEQQFPCVHVDRIHCSVVIDGINWRLNEADRKTTQLIIDVFQSTSGDHISNCISSLHKILAISPKVVERHLGILSRLLVELVGLSSREMRDSPKKPILHFSVSALNSILPIADSSQLEHVDAMITVLVAFFERHLLGTHHGHEMCDQLLRICLSYLDLHLGKARSLLAENVESIRRMCDTRPNSFLTQSIRDNIKQALSASD